jgi:anti-sigma factor RsiW
MNDHLSADTLVDFVHGELSPSDDAQTHAHLATCAPCREAYDLEASLSEVLRAAATADEREFPSLVSAAVWDRIRHAPPTRAARIAAFFRPAFALPVAAALVIGGYFVSPLAHPSHPTIDAAYYFEAHAAQTSQTPLSERTSALVLETSMLPPATADSPDTDGLAAASGAGADDVR